MIEEEETMVTTFDNPFSPFDEWISWFMYDTEMGYNTCGQIANYGFFDELTEELETKAAQLNLVQKSLSQNHVIVTRQTFDLLIKKKETQNKS